MKLVIYCITLLIIIMPFFCNGQEPTYKVTWSNEKILAYDDAGLPNISADGEKIIFIRYKDGYSYSEIWTINSDGSNAKALLAEDYTSYNSPMWSPDGARIIFVKDDFQIWIINFDGTGEKPLTGKKYEIADPVWWPDSSKILFDQWGSEPSGLYMLDFQGNSPTPFGEPEWGGPVAFSPDAQTLLILDGQDLLFLNPDGTKRKEITITTPLEHGEAPIWSPDGQYIILGNILYVIETGAEIPFLPDDVVQYKETGKPDLIGPTSVTLSKDGNKIAFVLEEPNAETYRAKIKVLDLVWH